MMSIEWNFFTSCGWKIVERGIGELKKEGVLGEVID